MKKVAMITWYRSINYGTCLQAYALYKKMCDMGFEVYIPSKLKFYTLREPKDFCRRCIRMVKRKFGKKIKLDKTIANMYNTRIEKINSFVDETYSFYEIKSNKDFYNLVDEVDIFVTGSDQIWNPYESELTYLLDFIKDNIKKKRIAYASSMGVSQLPRKYWSEYRKYLSKFDYIGVREKSFANELNKLLNREVCTVIDPTFLLNCQNWLDIQKECKLSHNDKFILCYFVGANCNESLVQYFAQITGCRVVYLTSESYVIPQVGEVHPETGIEEFIWLINNAQYIITDSFHACAVSLNLNKEFMAIKRFSDHSNKSQNSRMYDLLSEFGLEDRIVSDEKSMETLLEKPINYEKVNLILEQKRKYSEEYLLNALSD